MNINATPTCNIPINVMTNIVDTADGTQAKSGAEVRNRTTLHITLADGSANYLATGVINAPGIRCGEGSSLIVDDEERNADANGTEVVPIGAVINQDTTLLSGRKVEKGDPHTVLDSANPGKLGVAGGEQAAAIGGAAEETGGSMTFNGGNITAYSWTGDNM